MQHDSAVLLVLVLVLCIPIPSLATSRLPVHRYAGLTTASLGFPQWKHKLTLER